MDMRNGVLEESETDGGDEETQTMVPAPGAMTERSPPAQGDMLADLDAFQAEIEALRIKAAGGW